MQKKKSSNTVATLSKKTQVFKHNRNIVEKKTSLLHNSYIVEKNRSPKKGTLEKNTKHATTKTYTLKSCAAFTKEQYIVFHTHACN